MINLENIKVYAAVTDGALKRYFVKLNMFENAVFVFDNPKRLFIARQINTQYATEETSWLDFLVTTGFSKEDVIKEIKRMKSESCLR